MYGHLHAPGGRSEQIRAGQVPRPPLLEDGSSSQIAGDDSEIRRQRRACSSTVLLPPPKGAITRNWPRTPGWRAAASSRAATSRARSRAAPSTSV